MDSAAWWVFEKDGEGISRRTYFFHINKEIILYLILTMDSLDRNIVERIE